MHSLAKDSLRTSSFLLQAVVATAVLATAAAADCGVTGCSGRGLCDQGRCRCGPMWAGADCSFLLEDFAESTADATPAQAVSWTPPAANPPAAVLSPALNLLHRPGAAPPSLPAPLAQGQVAVGQQWGPPKFWGNLAEVRPPERPMSAPESLVSQARMASSGPKFWGNLAEVRSSGQTMGAPVSMLNQARAAAPVSLLNQARASASVSFLNQARAATSGRKLWGNIPQVRPSAQPMGAPMPLLSPAGASAPGPKLWGNVAQVPASVQPMGASMPLLNPAGTSARGPKLWGNVAEVRASEQPIGAPVSLLSQASTATSATQAFQKAQSAVKEAWAAARNLLEVAKRENSHEAARRMHNILDKVHQNASSLPGHEFAAAEDMQALDNNISLLETASGAGGSLQSERLAQLCGLGCSGHGTCLLEQGGCQCEDGWLGKYCDSKPCPADCSGKGMCVAGKCLCHPTRFGAGCEHQRCPGDCSGNGYCFAGRCQCTGDYGGADCTALIHTSKTLSLKLNQQAPALAGHGFATADASTVRASVLKSTAAKSTEQSLRKLSRPTVPQGSKSTSTPGKSTPPSPLSLLSSHTAANANAPRVTQVVQPAGHDALVKPLNALPPAVTEEVEPEEPGEPVRGAVGRRSLLTEMLAAAGRSAAI